MGREKVFGFKREVVYEYEKALLWNKGKLDRVLEPGRHWLRGSSQLVQRFDARKQLTTLSGQEVLSSDGVTVKVSLLVEYRVVDPIVTAKTTADYYQSIYGTVQLALRDIVGSLSIEDFLEQRNRIGPGLLERSVPAAAEIGVEITNADVKDIMFPGELKKMFSQVAAARQEGMAALERARGESAALRSLANTASLFDDHPNLMQMRLLQQIGDSDSNTFVIGAQSLVSGPGPGPVSATNPGPNPAPGPVA